MSAYSETVCELAEAVLGELLGLAPGERLRAPNMKAAEEASHRMVRRALGALRDEGVAMDHKVQRGPRDAPTRPGGWSCHADAELPETLKTRPRLLRELRASRRICYSYGRLLEALAHGGDAAGAVEWLARQEDLPQELVAAALARTATGRARPALELLAGGAL